MAGDGPNHWRSSTEIRICGKQPSDCCSRPRTSAWRPFRDGVRCALGSYWRRRLWISASPCQILAGCQHQRQRTARAERQLFARILASSARINFATTSRSALASLIRIRDGSTALWASRPTGPHSRLWKRPGSSSGCARMALARRARRRLWRAAMTFDTAAEASRLKGGQRVKPLKQMQPIYRSQSVHEAASGLFHRGRAAGGFFIK